MTLLQNVCHLIYLLCVMTACSCCVFRISVSAIKIPEEVTPLPPPSGPVVLSTPAQLVAPVVVARGTLSITTTEIYFEVDEEDPTFKNTDAKVNTSCPCSLLFTITFPPHSLDRFFILLLIFCFWLICKESVLCKMLFSTGPGLLRGSARQMDVQWDPSRLFQTLPAAEYWTWGLHGQQKYVCRLLLTTVERVTFEMV